MSRSFKKRPYHSICSSRGDKWCRQQYHKERRQRDRRLCKELEGCIDKELLYDNDCYLCTKDGVQPEERFVNESIDHSLRFADKWSWASDGGNYYWGDKNTYRRDFEIEVFGSTDRSGVRLPTPWEKYQLGVEDIFNTSKTEYTIRLEKQVPKKIDYGFYVRWGIFDTFYETVTKHIITEEYPPYIKSFEDGWVMTKWWRRKSYSLTRSKWDLFGFLFKSGIIPLDFKNEKELMDWLRANEESIVEKWLRAQLLRK